MHGMHVLDSHAICVFVSVFPVETHPEYVSTTKCLVVPEVVVVSVQESHPRWRTRVREVCRILLVTRQQVVELSAQANGQFASPTFSHILNRLLAPVVTYNCGSHCVEWPDLVDWSRRVPLRMSSSQRLFEPFQCLAVVAVVERVFPEVQTVPG